MEQVVACPKARAYSLERGDVHEHELYSRNRVNRSYGSDTVTRKKDNSVLICWFRLVQPDFHLS